jgi:hypothetical protein
VSRTKFAVIGSGNIGNLSPALQSAHRTQEGAARPQPEGVPA